MFVKFVAMTTLTIEIPDAKANLIKQLLKELDVKVIENSTYSSKFVAKIKKSRSEKGGKTVTAENLWQNIK